MPDRSWRRRFAPRTLLILATFVESGIVAQARHGDAGKRELDVLLQRLAVELVAVTSEQGEIARSAFRLYGKGRHRAGLNYGDCFSYALALISNQTLLLTGSDFSHTDIRAA